MRNTLGDGGGGRGKILEIRSANTKNLQMNRKLLVNATYMKRFLRCSTQERGLYASLYRVQNESAIEGYKSYFTQVSAPHSTETVTGKIFRARKKRLY